jgi:hypothetical protein
LHPSNRSWWPRPPATCRSSNSARQSESDATLLLYEIDSSGNEHYLAGASDAGNKANSEIAERLEAGHKYLVKVMVIYAPVPKALSVMYW